MRVTFTGFAQIRVQKPTHFWPKSDHIANLQNRKSGVFGDFRKIDILPISNMKENPN